MNIGDKVIHCDSDMKGVLIGKLDADLNLLDDWYLKKYGVKYSETFGRGRFGKGQLWLLWESSDDQLEPVFESELMLDE